MASVAHLWPLEVFLAHFGDARRPGCERVVQSACRDPVKRVASRVRSLWGNGFGAGGPLGGSVQTVAVSGRAAQGRKRKQGRKLLSGWSGGVKTGPSREGPLLKGPYQVDTAVGRGGSADRGRRWSSPVAWEAGDQALFPMTSRWR